MNIGMLDSVTPVTFEVDFWEISWTLFFPPEVESERLAGLRRAKDSVKNSFDYKYKKEQL